MSQYRVSYGYCGELGTIGAFLDVQDEPAQVVIAVLPSVVLWLFFECGATAVFNLIFGWPCPPRWLGRASPAVRGAAPPVWSSGDLAVIPIQERLADF